MTRCGLGRGLALITAALAFGLTACQHKSHRPPCPPGALCLAYGNAAEPTSLDPAHIDGVWETNIVSQLIVGLTRPDENGLPQPGVATSWAASPDGLTWTFHLRDAKWSDGVPVTADDFVFGVRRELDPKTASQSAWLLYPFLLNAEAVNTGKLPLSAAGVEAPDAHTLVLHLSHPWPLLPAYATGRILWPVPRHVVERWGESWTRPGRFVSDGPYTLAAWRLGDAVVVRKNPLFFDADQVCYNEVDFTPSSDLISNERSVAAGDLDVSSVQSNRVRYLSRTELQRFLHIAPQFGTFYLAFNMKDPALRDVRVRQALSMAIDRDFIAQKLLHAGQQPAYSLVPRGLPGYGAGPVAAWATWSLARRQSQARLLLAAAGYRPGHPLNLTIKQLNGPDHLTYMPSVQADWKAVGVDAKLQQEDTQVAYSDLEIHDFQVGLAGWVASDPIAYLDLLRSDTGGQNFGQYANPRYDAELNAAGDSPDIAVRAQHMKSAETIILADAAIAPLYYTSSRGLVHPQITGWVNNPFDTHPISHLCRLSPLPTAARPAVGAAAS